MANNKRLFVYFMSGLSVLAPMVTQASGLDQTIGLLKSEPYEMMAIDDAKNSQLFNKYCLGDAKSSDAPKPNYTNELVKRAAAKLSETKTTSSTKLGMVASSEFADHVKSAKNSATLLAKVDGGSVSKLATELLKQIATANTKSGFPAESAKSAADLTTEIGKNLQSLTEPLATAFQAELTGVNFKVLLDTAKKLLPKIKAASTPVDLSAIKSLVTKLKANLSNEIKAMDGVIILSATAQIESEIKAIKGSNTVSDPDESLSYLIQSLESIKTQFNDGATPDADNMLYQLSDVIDGIKSAKENDKVKLSLSTLGEKALFALKTQYLDTQRESIFAALDQVINSLSSKDSADSSDTRYAIDNSVDTLKVNATQFGSATTALYQNLVLEHDKYLIIDVATILQNLLSSLENDSKDDATSYAESVASAIQDLAVFKKDASIIAMAKILGSEAAKAASEMITTNMITLNDALKSSSAVLTDDVIYKFNDVTDSLTDSKIEFQPETKKLVAKLKDLLAPVSSLATLGADLKTPAPTAVKSNHFYFYAPITRIYEPSPSKEIPDGIETEAHSFLTQLCGEYRDRATMIEAKLRWASRIFILPKSSSKSFTIDPSKNVWAQIPASAYYPYLALATSVWEAKRDAQPRYIKAGDHANIDNPVPGFTVCETDYMFSEYVGKQKEFDDYSKYYEGYKSYFPNCSKADQTDYYDFRGDSNFKHYSPESNGMIWYATSLARACKNSTTAKANQTIVTNEDCRKYFTRPFYYRYNAARAGLATWLFRDEKHAAQFISHGSMVAIYPHFSPELAPFSFSYDSASTTGDLFELDPQWLNQSGAWNTPDIGFNNFMGIGTASANPQKAIERIRDAVDRHTDWYASGFNDKNGTAKDKAYSPFVASSYVMSASDNFTRCGLTVECPDDGLKRWMFVFRVKAASWYNPARVLNNEPVNFDTMWLDETSFGESGLADSERAWDRLGTPQEDEFDSILYLPNVEQDDSSSDTEPTTPGAGMAG